MVNGLFTINFVLPKDINYQFGEGKISYYAADTTLLEDAGGYYSEVVIGGTYPDAPNDDEGPLVRVFMNDTLFLDGGITGANPVLVALISDDNGINITGNNIGHDLLGILDNDSQNAFILNDFFTAEQDDYRNGMLRFPLSGLEEGLHHLEVRAWDIANNLGTGEISFLVVDGPEGVIRNLMAYPNPFFENTRFAFEHNLEKGVLDMNLEIFDLYGKKVREIRASATTDHYRNGSFEWDGRSVSGSEVSPGMYLYRVNIIFTGNNGVKKVIHSDTEKLLFIR